MLKMAVFAPGIHTFSVIWLLVDLKLRVLPGQHIRKKAHRRIRKIWNAHNGGSCSCWPSFFPAPVFRIGKNPANP